MSTRGQSAAVRSGGACTSGELEAACDGPLHESRRRPLARFGDAVFTRGLTLIRPPWTSLLHVMLKAKNKQMAGRGNTKRRRQSASV